MRRFNLQKLIFIFNKYIIYNQYFQVIICQICKIKIIDDILLHFQRYHEDILLKIHQAINAYINDLNMRSFRDIKISIEEINMIEEIKIVSEFKCIAEFEY